MMSIWPNYLAARFQSLNRLAPYYHSATDDIEGRDVPLGLAALQAGLRIDEVDRTLQAVSIIRPGCRSRSLRLRGQVEGRHSTRVVGFFPALFLEHQKTQLAFNSV